ncbi:hypothetical protein [Agromyces neolithicus]|uniref:Uncharacterized protein n=1 Tax=Agromyces neolithicus TaxID=269420 RepID=A0ABN2M9B0_9MICO
MISEDVLKLGRALSAELDETDTLGRWMAHHLSDLLDRRLAAENSADDAEIAELVLRLWASRASAPLRHQPFLRYTEILRFIDRIDRLASGYPFPRAENADRPPADSNFESIAMELVSLSAAAGAVSSAMLTELQLHAANDESSWRSYADLLGGGEADEALRTLLNRMVARSAGPDERRADLLNRLRDLEQGARAARKTIEHVELAKMDSEHGESSASTARSSRITRSST